MRDRESISGFTLILGGARSGKSAFALRLASERPAPRVYIATAEALDDEMKGRIERHRKERGAEWETIEEPVSIAERLRGLDAGVVLIDCITLWLSNRMGAGLDDAEILSETGRLIDECSLVSVPVVMVSNETGLGVVPENALARRFRDTAGTVNRLLAEAASTVFLVAAGLPLKLK